MLHLTSEHPALLLTGLGELGGPLPLQSLSVSAAAGKGP